MKRISLLILAAVLSLTAGVQTAMAQKVTLYMAGNQTYECDIAQLDSIVFSEGQTIIPDEEIVVTVDAYGNADGGHQFTRIDEATFLIDDIKYRYENGSLLVSGYDPVFFSGVAKIISKLIYNGRAMNVVGIGNGAFDGCTSLTSINIPEGVTSIGSSAFLGCSSLTSVTIGSGVTSIGNTAFFGCSSLTSVTIGSGVTSIGNYAFVSCSGLTSVTIPNSVTSIGEGAFVSCTSLTSVTIPNSVTSIGDYAFYGCFFKTEFFVNNSSLTSDNNWGATLYDEERSDGLIIINNIVVGCRPWAVSITIPNNVTSIGDYAFEGCSGLTSVTIPESVTSIGRMAFSGCSSLTSVTIPNSVTSIGESAFASCTSLTSVTIPNSVTSIGESAFYYCTSLTSVTIPESVTNIGEMAFSGCSGLTDVYCYAENVPSTGRDAFDSSTISSATLHVPAGSVRAYEGAFPWSGFGSIVAIE